MAKDLAGSLVWANSAAAGTVAGPLISDDTSHTPGQAIVHVHNPSTVSAITVTCLLRWTDNGGTDRDSELTSFSVPANSTRSFVVQGFGMGTSMLRATNDTALGAAQGFTARVRAEFLG